MVIGEIYPLPIRAKGVALATASNWLWNCVIAVITPYLVDQDYGNLKSKVFFIWGSALFLCILFAFFLIPETKGLTLEQVDQMLEETTPRTSAKWIPHQTFAHEMGFAEFGPAVEDPKTVFMEHTDDNSKIAPHPGVYPTGVSTAR